MDVFEEIIVKQLVIDLFAGNSAVDGKPDKCRPPATV
jgi:hypothetical protein